MTLRDRFEGRYQPEPNTGCWLWLGALNKKGYGVHSVEGRSLLAHRAALLVLTGKLDDALQVDHLCRQRSCVNPLHLEQVTLQENVRRGISGAWQKSRTHCPRGHEYAGRNLYVNRRGQRICRTCSAESWRRSYPKSTGPRAGIGGRKRAVPS